MKAKLSRGQKVSKSWKRQKERFKENDQRKQNREKTKNKNKKHNSYNRQCRVTASKHRTNDSHKRQLSDNNRNETHVYQEAMKIIFERAADIFMKVRFGLFDEVFRIAFHNLEPLQTEWRCSFTYLNEGMINNFLLSCRVEKGLQTTALEAISSGREDILSFNEKIFRKKLLVWQNVTDPETIALRKMSGPRAVV